MWFWTQQVRHGSLTRQSSHRSSYKVHRRHRSVSSFFPSLSLLTCSLNSLSLRSHLLFYFFISCLLLWPDGPLCFLICKKVIIGKQQNSVLLFIFRAFSVFCSFYFSGSRMNPFEGLDIKLFVLFQPFQSGTRTWFFSELCVHDSFIFFTFNVRSLSSAFDFQSKLDIYDHWWRATASSISFY